ncbi:MAG: carbamoyl-phosphate synthase large subunit [Acidobacteriota bacterium]
MPRRDDLASILIIGSGPIIIGQGCEFDYSGVQACKALREEKYRVILVNSNPATIMTDPDIAHRTYVEPLEPEVVERIIETERPDALLPTVGGQTALNLAVRLAEAGTLSEYGVELIGAKLRSMKVCEERHLFKAAMEKINLQVPASSAVHSLEEAERFAASTAYPLVIRPSYTLGGSGGGIAYNVEEFRRIVQRGLSLSLSHEVLVEESLLGWKEFELEVMRDCAENVVVICSIENVDPMGIHTGDSITVAPAQTLTDREYQRLRDAAIHIMRQVGVETGGSNIQFAVHPDDGRVMVIEMNPRVSRSSALASKATGFPIAKIAAKLAVGYTLDEIPNDITRETPSCFEPTIDYCVVKIPRFDFEKFPSSDRRLGTQMKSVGECMAIGRTFKEALQKGMRSLEIGCAGLGADGSDHLDSGRIREILIGGTPDRILAIRMALISGMTVEAIADLTKVDRWFVANVEELVHLEGKVRAFACETIPDELLRTAKRFGFSDRQLGYLLSGSAADVRARRVRRGITPVYCWVDTCGAEFEARTPYLYSTYEEEDEASVTDRHKVMILGGGPNRIGQGIEFDYCCCQAAFALRELGVESIMVNCNPETVSTDYDTSDRLYFEPVTLEDVLNIFEKERPDGLIVQFGGQTPLRLAMPLREAGIPILGTLPEMIDLAEDRGRFEGLMEKLHMPKPESGTAVSFEGARAVADGIGYPVIVRPSYVLGGRAMAIVYDCASLKNYMRMAAEISQDHPVLIDRFLEDAFEVDVDAICDGEVVLVAGIMQHIEEAGVHSGDSACVLPPYLIAKEHLKTIRHYTRQLALALEVRGLINVQYAIKDDVVYVLEVNPRASRTVPFVSKATGLPIARIATRIMLGERLSDMKIQEPVVDGFFVKESVFPFVRFPGEDPVLGPEMKSTGEVMGIAPSFGIAFAKAQMSVGTPLPTSGTAFISVNDNDKKSVVPIARALDEAGFVLVATSGTGSFLHAAGLEVEAVYKVNEGRPNIADRIKNGAIHLIINTPLGSESYKDEQILRQSAYAYGVPTITTLSGGAAAVAGIQALQNEKFSLRPLQDYGSQTPAPS